MALSTATSTFLYCTPTAAATVTSTVYTTVLPAACETGIWDATYVITDYCLGSCHGYQYPKLPPGFGVTTVHCPVCPTPDVVITCPTSPAGKPTGPLPYPVVTGNGVTITGAVATPTITIHESSCTKDCQPTVYPPGPVNPVNPPVNPPVGPGSQGTIKPPTVQTATGYNPIPTAGANSVSRSLGVISGLAAVAGYIYLL
ncbi:hypothetical protein Micbo1qcDRAFT_49876 [Microdochium bolleyi]|jgi:hypothetical protein|uniref:Uncharacterized protein n=1 Tax=Microdochium bolleyi TaxID=196109 RepID=A0A136J680_9PEZI|nr:hypothetical protein Micbo1qcDRAFT_49876 [Microdochium bolleyi]